METKKTQKASLENKRVIFLEIGLIVALFAVIGAFSYSSGVRKTPALQASAEDVPEIEIVPITQDTPPEPPKVPVIPMLSDVLEIVENPVETDSFFTIEDTDIDVPVYTYRTEVEEEIIEEDIPFVNVETKPRFQGGEATTFSRWVSEHLSYPTIAQEMCISGRVMLEFTIRKDGRLADIKVLRGVDPILDEEAIRVVSNSPRWEPGMQQDRPVNVRYQFPVIFRLR